MSYTVAANEVSDGRSGYLRVAGYEYLIMQDGKPCAYEVAPLEYSHGEGSEFAEVLVVAETGCGWVAESSVPWMTVLAGHSGSGSGSVIYAVDRNDGPARSGTIVIAGNDYVVSQASGVREVSLTGMSVASGHTNVMHVTLDAHGGENTLAFSLCFDTNLLSFVSAELLPTAPLSAGLTVAADEAADGRVGLTVAMPPGHSMPAGTGVVVAVAFAALPVDGKPWTTVSVCSTPVATRLVDGVNFPLAASFGTNAVQVLGLCSLAEALDTTNLLFGVSSVPWLCQDEVSFDGEDAASSGEVPDGGEAYMELTVDGPGTLSFIWKVSSEPDNDRLRLYMDGSEQYRISGEVDWEWRSFVVPAGTHVMRWRYNKNATLIGGQDRAWVDRVTYVAFPPVVSTQPVSQAVDSGTTVSFSVVASGQAPLTYQWVHGSSPLVGGPGVVGANGPTLTLSNVQPAQAGLYHVVVTSPQGAVSSSGATLSVTPVLPLPESLDASNLTFTTSGNAVWVGQGGVTHDGVDAGRSGAVGNSQSSIFTTTVTGPGTISFWWKVSSESGSDRLRFYVNGTEQNNISGEIDWQKKTYSLGSGAQTLEWRYTKNSSGAAGQDRGWVDEVVFTPQPVTLTAQPTNQVVDQGATAVLAAGISGTPPVSYQWYYNGAPLQGATSHPLTLANVQPAQSGVYALLASNAGAVVMSSNATLLVNVIVPLAEALDTTNLTWTTSGTPAWVGQTAVSRDGVDAARSGRISHDGTTSFQTSVTGPGTVSFWWKVSADSSDRLRFYLGGSQQESISGEVDWIWRSWTVPSGSQTLEWRYTKSSSGSAGQDRGWVDQIRYVANNTPTVPFIAVQPADRSVVAPAGVSFNALAGGSMPLSYQWLFNGQPLTNGGGVSGVATTNLSITGATSNHVGWYAVVVTNLAGRTTSSVAALSVVTAPVITNPPASQGAIAGATVQFTVGAIGQPTLGYQWYHNGTNIVSGGKFSGANTATLTITNVQEAQAGVYSVIVSNASGTANSLQGSGTLTVWAAARSGSVAHDGHTALQSALQGPGTLRFSWKVSSETNSDAFVFLLDEMEQERISGEVDWQARTVAVPAGLHTVAWRYVKDAAGSAGQDAGWLDGLEYIPEGVPVAPAILTQPTDRSLDVGGLTTFEVPVQGTMPLSFQWRLNGVPLLDGAGVSGAQTRRLTLSGLQAGQAGSYSLHVSNTAGVAESSNAVLTVTVPAGGNVPAIVSQPASQTVSENAAISFSVAASGAPTLSYQWFHNDVPLADVSGVSTVAGATSPTLTISNVQATVAGSFSVVVSNAFGTVSSASAHLVVLSLGEAVGAPYIPFAQAGFTSWVAQSSIFRSGGLAARSGVIPDSQNTRLETYVEGPGTISFWWKVSSESVNDNLRFYVGATELVRISGEVDWQQQSFAVPAGTQLLKWRYSKDASTGGGQDAAWVDDVVYAPASITVAPSFTNQPVSQTVRVGQAATFIAGLAGSMPMTFQWLSNGVAIQNSGTILGVQTPRLTLLNVPSQSASYSLLASNAAGFAVSEVVTLNATSVLAAPVFSSQPASQNVIEGTAVSFSVSATGALPLSYQWLLNGVNLTDGAGVSGVNTPVLTLHSVEAAQIGSYSVVVSNAAGTVASSSAALTVVTLGEVVGAPYLDFAVTGQPWVVQNGQTYIAGLTNGGARLTVGTPPSITAQPAGQTLVEGADAVFTVGTAGSPPLEVQWRRNGVPLADGGGISGATSHTLTIVGAQPGDAGNYSVLVTNAVGTIISSNAALVVLSPPSIVTPPLAQSVGEGATVSLSVLATGTGPLVYQWQRNGSNIVNGGSVSGADTATLMLNNAQPSQGGLYTVTISNAVGGVVSSPVQLTVIAAMTIGESMNAPYLVWNADLGAPWIVQTNVTHDGDAAAQSGAIGHSDVSWMETTVVGPGTVRFWWKVSSQTNADVLSFSVDGATWAQSSGDTDWQRMSFAIPGGEVTLRWTYTKDGSVVAGADRGWVDEVDFVPATGPSVPVIVQEPEGQDVNPGANVTMVVAALGTAPLSYQWRFEGRELADGGNILGSKTPTLNISSVRQDQAGLYDVVVRNPYSLDISEPVFLNVIPVVAIETAVDTDYTNMVWITGGSSAWRGQTNYNSDRIDAAQSGVLAHNQTNWVQTVVSGPGAISFWWRTSSETNGDRLRFTIDGVEVANLSGETDWRQRTFTIDYPSTVLRWAYTKNASGSAGLDRAWLDQVNFGPSAPIITNTSEELQIVDQGTTIRINVDASGTKPFSYQWKWNGTNLVNSDTNLPVYPGFITGATGNRRLTISNAQPWQSGLYVAEVYNPGGVAISPPFTVQVVPSLPLGLALNTNLVWETEGYSWWVASTNIHRDGLAARNGTLPASESTTLRTTVNGPGTLSFWWRASTETNADIMTFTLDGSTMATISGNQTWQKKTYDLLDGAYVLEWKYEKNGLFTNNLDQVFLDEVVFAPIAPIITNQPVAQTIDQGSTLNLSAGIRGTPPLVYQWMHQGVPLTNGGNVSGATTAALRITGIQLSQAGSYSLQVGNVVGTTNSASALVTVLPTFPIAEALDITGYTWTTGSPGWIGQNVTTHDGVDAARSPVTAHSATASMQATIAGPGTVNFWWKVSSQTNSDALIFYVGSSEQARISGETEWRQASFSIPAGNQVIKWTYSKNSSVVAGQDRGWVDQLVFVPTPPTVTTHPVGTNVDQGATPSFSVAASGTPPLFYQWRLNGSDLPDATNATLALPGVQPSQAGNYSVVVMNAAGSANSLSAALTVNTLLPLAEALDGSNLVWSTSGSPLWVGQLAVTKDGVDAARIAAVPHSGSASMQVTLTGPGTVSFWWKVSSQTNGDYLTFYTNNVQAVRISGEVDWRMQSISLGSGSQTLKWTYSKNSSTTAGQDRAWVDQVLFGPVPPNITAQPANRGVDEGGTANFSVTVAGTPPFTYQWQRNNADLAEGAGVSGVTSSNLVITGAQIGQAGSYRVLVSGVGGATVSSPVTLSVYPILDLAEALDTPGLTWTTNGTPPWVGHGEVTHDGSDAARSGAIGHSGTTSMSTIFSGPGTVSFWWKVSSQTNSDYLTLYTNGTLAVRISGETDWQFRSVNIGAGAQTLTWTYSKNGSTVAGQDRAWVDQVSFGLVAPTIVTQPASVTAEPGTNVSFTVVAAATPPIYYQWLFNGSPIQNGTGIGGADSATLVVSNAGAVNLGGYSVIVSNSVGTVTSLVASLTLSSNVSLAQALDGGLAYTTGGTGQPWKGQTGTTRDGQDAAQTGAVGDSTYTWIKTTVTGPGPLSFWWKVSSEQDHDYLRFMVDAVDQVKISGDLDWQQITYNVPAGTHELQWRYSKNATLADGEDRGWVDYVYYGTVPPPIVIVTSFPPTVVMHPVSQTVDVGDFVTLNVAATGSGPMTYRWFQNGTNALNDGGNIGGATTSELSIYNIAEADAANYSVVVSNGLGVAASSAARVTVLPVVDLAEAVDSFELFFTTVGEASWVGHTVVTHDGTDAGRSGRIADGQSSTMEAMVNGPGLLTFWWKVSSQTNADYLAFFVNGVPQDAISGETDWQSRAISLPDGLQILEWTYYKDGAVSTNADRGWVDQLNYVPNGEPPLTNNPTGVMDLRLSVSGNLLNIGWEGNASKTYKVYYKEELTDEAWILLDTEVSVTWKVVEGEIVPDVVVATVSDAIGSQTRFYKVLEY